MAMIYESPDKGKTVYAREIGQPFNSRVLIKSPAIAEEPLYERLAKINNNRIRSNKRWLLKTVIIGMLIRSKHWIYNSIVIFIGKKKWKVIM